MADKGAGQQPGMAPAGPSSGAPFQQYPGFPQFAQAQFPNMPGMPAMQYPQSQGLSAPHAEQLRAFWAEQVREIQQVPCDPAEFKNHQLPLARIKKIMKSDEDVRMISAEAPVLFAKACEMFILELTLRSWYHAEENKRRTLQRNDIAAAITKTDIFDFLIDIVPREDVKQEGGDQAGTSGPVPQSMPPNMPPGMFGFPYGMAPAPGPDGMMRPGGMPQMDPAQMMAYSAQYMQQQMAGQAWPGAPGMPPGSGAPDPNKTD